MSQSQSFFLTGCASGIGRHLADVLIAQRHRVWATDINFDALSEHAKRQHWPDSVQTRRLDVRDAESWQEQMREAAETFGQVDVVMNIAGYLLTNWFHEAPPEEVHRNLDINAKGVIFGTQAAARVMIRQHHGHIINIASMAGLAPIAGMALYTASKYAVRGFSLAAAQELRPHGVKVTVICPDAVETPLLDPNKSRDAGAILFSSPRLLKVEDISDLILNRVLTRRPLEAYIPAHRGVLARFTDLFPASAFAIAPFFVARGRKLQARLRSAAH